MIRPARRRSIAGAAALVGIVLLPSVTVGLDLPADLPPDSPAIGSVEREALAEFQRDPMANGKALLRLSAGSARRLPLVTLLAAADVHLRAGRTRTATRFFREAARREAGPPWDTFARLGLGWTALARHDFQAAAKYYRGVDAAGPLGGIARVMMAWLTAFRGRYAESVPLFDRAAAATDLPPTIRQVAMLGAAYARYWLGSFDDAAAAFDRLVSPPSVLSDDARYGAAWSRVRAGDLDSALPALVALAGEASADTAPKRVSEAAVSLSPATVARSGRESTARISGFAGPDARMVAMFDGDGAALARAALALLGREDELGTHPVPAADAAALAERDAGSAASSVRSQPASKDSARSAPTSATNPAAPGPTWWRAFWITVGLLALASLVVLRRRGEVRGKPPVR
jgi:hypothetical protein